MQHAFSEHLTPSSIATRAVVGTALVGLALGVSAAFAQAPDAHTDSMSKTAAAQKIVDRTGTTLERVLDFEVVARLDLGEGEIHFIDETVDGDFGFGILELGKVDLGRFYEREASALEIYLALAPEGAAIHDALYRAHDLARQLNPAVPEMPRDFAGIDATMTPNGSADGRAAEKGVTFVDWSKSTNNCWGWGGENSYDPNVGNPSGSAPGHHDYNLAQIYFNSWSGISSYGASDFNVADDAEGAGWYVNIMTTPWGNERAVAMCVTHAALSAGTGWWDCAPGGDSANTVKYKARLRGESSSSSWYSAQTVTLDAYGEGARYKNQSTSDRRYTLQVWDQSVESPDCKERFQALYRNRNTVSIGGPGGLTGR